MDPARARKLGGRIAQIVAEMLERRIKDPRLGFVTVTEARLTNDLREATVFYTVYGSDEERAGTAAALASAVGVIRSEVGRQTGMRHTPSHRVQAGYPAGQRQEHRGTRGPGPRGRRGGGGRPGGREPAGEADPYRVPAEPDAGEDAEDERRGRPPAGRRGLSAITPASRRRRRGILAVVTAEHTQVQRDPVAGRIPPDRVPGGLLRGQDMEDDWARAVAILGRAREICLACHVRPGRRRARLDAGGGARAARLRAASSGQRVIASFGDDPFEIPQDPALPAGHRPAQPAGRGPGPAGGDGHLRRGQRRPAGPARSPRRARGRADRAGSSRVQHPASGRCT